MNYYSPAQPRLDYVDLERSGTDDTQTEITDEIGESTGEGDGGGKGDGEKEGKGEEDLDRKINGGKAWVLGELYR